MRRIQVCVRKAVELLAKPRCRINGLSFVLATFGFAALAAGVHHSVAARTASIAKVPALALPGEGVSRLPGGNAAQQQGPMQADVIMLGLTGFIPDTITQPHGKTLLMVNNSALLTDMHLVLDRLASGQGSARARVIEQHQPAQVPRFRTFIDLPPGTYELSEAAHPQWTCTINVTP